MSAAHAEREREKHAAEPLGPGGSPYTAYSLSQWAFARGGLVAATAQYRRNGSLWVTIAVAVVVYWSENRL